ncbi:ATP-binding protein [Stenotrophomonas tumulicola]|uniref:ATP-binding protein n=1 Tax=Stenotrophomonas tumulicola TaxID=1685415 RepID=UPI0015FB879D|nr:ATP-binding protein [Stenotrophomonas tumulicola]
MALPTAPVCPAVVVATQAYPLEGWSLSEPPAAPGMVTVVGFLLLAFVAIGLVHLNGYWKLRREIRLRRELQRRIDEVSDNLPVVVFQARRERDGRIHLELLAGDTPQLFSAAPRELKADPSRILAAICLPDRTRVLTGLMRAVRRICPVSLQFTTQGVRGMRCISMHAWPTLGPANEQRWTGYWMDVSEERAREQAIARAHARTEAEVEGRGRLIATLGTGISGPMHALLQRMAMLRGGELDAHQRAALDSLEDASVMLARILEDVLALSATEDADMALDSTPVDLRAVLDSMQQLLQPVAVGKGLKLGQRVDPRLARWLQVDGTRLRQILFNLVGNAIKFTEHGDVSMQVHVVDDTMEIQRLRIEVHDTGIGIAAERQQAIFEPFAQADTFTARRYGGTGLGLGICRRLVHRMGGSLQLRSVPGEGTVFAVELPLPHAMPDPPAVDRDSRPPLPPASVAGGAVPRVLVAEDHPTQQLLMQWWLRGLGVEVDVAGDGEQALALWRHGHPVLVFTDDQMPGLGGRELVHAIREEERGENRAGVPIIGMSAEVGGMRGVPLDHLLAKPISRRTLIEAIGRVRPDLLDAAGNACVPGMAAPAQEDVLSLAGLGERFGSVDIARELVHSLRTSMDDDLQALRREWDDDELAAAARRLHRLAGGVGSIGLHALAMTLRELSEARAPLDAARRDALQVRLQRLVQHLRELEAA